MGDALELEDSVSYPVSVVLKATHYSPLSKNHVLLDNEANASVFSNPKLLSNLRKVDIPCHISGVNSDGKPLVTYTIGDFGEFRDVYYHPSSTANILSFSQTKSYCNNGYDPTNDSFFSVTPNGVRFEFPEIQDSGLYAYEASIPKSTLFTVTDRKIVFNKRQLEEADIAREYVRRLGHPSESALMSGVSKGAIINLPFTVHDLHRATQIYGTNLADIRGKTHKRKTRSIDNDTLPRVIPSEVSFNTDLMYVNSQAFLLTVVDPIGLAMLNHLGSGRGARETTVVRKALLSQFSEVTSRKFTVVSLNTDGEGAVHVVGKELGAKGVTLNPTGAGAHVGPVERKIQEIKERARAIITTLSFKLPLTLIAWLMLFAVSRINLLPHKNSPVGLSPAEVFKGRKIDANIDLRCAFGDYCEVFDPTSDNTLKSRTQASISLMPVGNRTGSVFFLSLASGRVIRRDQFHILPTPDLVISHMNILAAQSYSKAKSDDSGQLDFRMGNTASLVSDTANPSSASSDTSDVELSLYDTPLISVDEPHDVPADTVSPTDTVFTEETADSVPLPFEPLPPTVPVPVTIDEPPVSALLPVSDDPSTTDDHSTVSGVPSDTGPSLTAPQSPVSGVSVHPDPEPEFFLSPRLSACL